MPNARMGHERWEMPEHATTGRLQALVMHPNVGLRLRLSPTYGAVLGLAS